MSCVGTLWDRLGAVGGLPMGEIWTAGEKYAQQGTRSNSRAALPDFYLGRPRAECVPLMGSGDEIMNSRCFRMNHIPAYRYLEIFVNKLYYPFQGPERCRNAYMKEVRSRQWPHDCFDKAIAMGIFPTDPDKLGDMVRVPE